MERLKYDSLYKFIVSIGIVIIIIPFVFMYLILKNNDVILIKENEIQQLTNISQNIILTEQNYKYIMLSNPIIICIIIVIMVSIGLIIVKKGMHEWKEKLQIYEDERIRLSLEKLRYDIKKMTDEEKKEKIIDNIELIEDKNIDHDTQEKVKEEKISKYENIQEKAYKVIRKQFKDYKIFEEVKLEEQVYDCIALNEYGEYNRDYIFEIKYFPEIGDLKGRINRLEEELIHRGILYNGNTGRYATSILLIILDSYNEKDKLENQKILNIIDKINEKDNCLIKIILTDIDKLEKELIFLK